VAILALGLRPGLVGLLVASGPQQQVGDQRLRTGVIVEFAVLPGGRYRRGWVRRYSNGDVVRAL
jgi:hypothetical protein